MPQPRVAQVQVIEGVPTLVRETKPPLPAKLDALLTSIKHVTRREDIRPTGATAACEQWRTHRFGVLREGTALCTDGVIRDLRVEMCRDCGACCVRDISIDRLPGLPIGGQGPARRDQIIGWYSGARRGQRQYR